MRDMKLSDYVASFLAKQGIRHVFAITGGASVHLIHSVADTPGITYVCPAHEQAGAMAADAYSRMTRNLGAAISTSGPGATNLITGICCAYYDSVPVIYLTGQVATFRSKGNLGVRQIGFQETDTVDICRPITKYAVRVDDPKKIRYEMEKACYLARFGRPGPVLIDLPDDVQRAQVSPEELEPFIPEPETKDHSKLEEQVAQAIVLLERAKRPVIILGWGVRLARADEEAIEFVERLGFPVAPTWAMLDLLPSSHPLVAGAFGTHGTRYGNFTVQNADLVLAIGARLDSRETGSPPTTFAREAKKIVVDTDPYELGKFGAQGLSIDLLIHADAKEFLQAMNQQLVGMAKQDISQWTQRIVAWKNKYPICPPEYYEQEEVNPYVFVKTLSTELAEGDVVVVDASSPVAWTMQSLEAKPNQRWIHAFNNSPMGYALPASIGACFALDGRRVICVTGDGSMLMNIQELATVIRHQLPIKIFLLNNHGYSMIQQTEDQWLGSRYIASSVEGGLAFPDFIEVAQAYGYKTVTIARNSELSAQIREVLDSEGPVFCNVEIPPYHRAFPIVKFGRPLEDQEPLLDRKEFLKNMIVKPLEVSLTKD
jgi:acetolactate synthase-1/2/3 large subunit